jgi:hypothetical protein
MAHIVKLLFGCLGYILKQIFYMQIFVIDLTNCIQHIEHLQAIHKN